MTKGFSRPFSPQGSTSLVPELPWKFAGDLLLIHFRADKAALNALLPAPLEPSEKQGEAFFWSPNLRCYPNDTDPLSLSPYRSSYNVAVIGIPCKLNGVETMYSAYQWADKDWLIVLSWFLGACSKLAVLEQSGTHNMLPRMAREPSVGTRIRKMVSRNGEKLIDLSFAPKEIILMEDMDFYLSSLPLTCERHIPDCSFPRTGRPLVHDLTQMVMNNTEFGEILAGDANLSFFEADNEALTDINPTSVMGGYWLPMSFSLEGIKSIHNYLG
jgi:acetoacetate decarboxylase|tara:strand:- start:268 stop:1080 length:813 start_codon:yes stop_codon:yes gene_type:complete